ncbi:NPP1 domain protein [Ceratocystis lukuohia]|uniref:Necrosis inducing protein (NPP1) n=2 Tax=Ceratocystis TaxID=5157 RepID=A0A0F8D8K1_CERFI|nr:Necrosis inducing protein (NPP1) [Ceratocystis platani]
MLFKSFTMIALVASSVFGAPAPIAETSPVHQLMARAPPTKGHDQIVALPEAIPNNAIGAAYRKLQPWIRIDSGCFPYPAVDAQGNISGGLKKGGSPSGKCRGSDGQLYVRSCWHQGRYAIMYAWYMPKDQGTGRLAITGHRHEWENLIIYIDNPDSCDPKILGISASKHSTYNKYNYVPEGIFPNGDLRMQIKYYQDIAFFGTHSIDVEKDGRNGREQVMVEWEMLPDLARKSLDEANFGDANFPLKDGNFFRLLDRANPF